MTEKYVMNVEHKKFEIDFTARASRTIEDMELSKYVIYGTILCMGKELLELKDQEQIMIIDKYLNIGIAGVYDGVTEAIDIIAVIPKERIYVKEGMRVCRFE